MSCFVLAGRPLAATSRDSLATRRVIAVRKPAQREGRVEQSRRNTSSVSTNAITPILLAVPVVRPLHGVHPLLPSSPTDAALLAGGAAVRWAQPGLAALVATAPVAGSEPLGARLRAKRTGGAAALCIGLQISSDVTEAYSGHDWHAPKLVARVTFDHVPGPHGNSTPVLHQTPASHASQLVLLRKPTDLPIVPAAHGVGAELPSAHHAARGHTVHAVAPSSA
eukprot:scaffold88358_cov71-Phaeocystis_antarctica.AAC.11